MRGFLVRHKCDLDHFLVNRGPLPYWEGFPWSRKKRRFLYARSAIWNTCWPILVLKGIRKASVPICQKRSVEHLSINRGPLPFRRFQIRVSVAGSCMPKVPFGTRSGQPCPSHVGNFRGRSRGIDSHMPQMAFGTLSGQSWSSQYGRCS